MVRDAHMRSAGGGREPGVSARHLSYLETGRASPSREMVLTLAQGLEVRPEELEGRGGSGLPLPPRSW